MQRPADDKLKGETVVLRLALGPADIRVLRRLLKALLRRYGLRCVSIAVEPRALAAARLVTLKHGGDRKSPIGGLKQDEAAALFNVSALSRAPARCGIAGCHEQRSVLPHP
jgi:hypothetical protein